MSEKLLSVSSSPHIRGKQTTRSIMTDVFIALMPASVLAVVFYGVKALVLILVGVVSAVAAEAVTQKIKKTDVTVKDMSAAVTGLLLALNMPINAPWWMLIIGCVFAIVVVKQLFGGIGHNFANPALAARILLVASWPSHMTGNAYLPVDAVASATPLALLKEGTGEVLPSLLNMFVGGPNVYGCIGEVSALALIIGGIYLRFVKKVITWHIPVTYIGVYAVISLLFGASLNDTLFMVCAGGLMLGAVFMATDYVTSPSTALGQVIYAAGCAIITFIIRVYGGYPEGVSFSILFMNFVTPLLDKFIRIKKYGEVKKNA